jgi:hypothetical protein
MENDHPYRKRQALLTSKHHKLDLIAPAFQEFVGLHLQEEALDTDQLGTFSGEIERYLPPLETAIAKARLGMRERGLSLGIASEGSIGADPMVPFITSDIEHLVLVDDEREIVISEVYRSLNIRAARIEATPGQDLSEFLERSDFPSHALIVRPREGEASQVVKGITALAQLQTAIASCANASKTGYVVIESDLRAHHSPSRRRNIEAVARALAARTSRLCPQCHAPGWGRVGYEKGVRCGVCTTLIPEALRQVLLGCVRCDEVQKGEIVSEVADPSICPRCNP